MVVQQSRRPQRGSIVLVLLVSSVLLLFVLALGTLSSMNINIVRSQVEYNQALMTAQAAAAQLLYDIEEYERENSAVIDLTASTYTTMDLQKRYSEKPVFPRDSAHIDGEVVITFDRTKKLYSTDNSQSAIPARGWNDRDSTTASVPPFSIDLIITVNLGGSTRTYQAVINRTWPYAAFCARGPILVTAQGVYASQKLTCSPSVIKGNLLSFYDPLAAGGLAPPTGAGPEEATAFGPALASGFYSGAGLSSLPKASIALGGMDIGDTGNTITGNARTPARDPRNGGSADMPDPITISKDNILEGRKIYGVPPGIVDWGRNPLIFVRMPDIRNCREVEPAKNPEIETVNTGGGTLTFEQGKLDWTGADKKAKRFQRLLNQYMDMVMTNPARLPSDLQEKLKPYLESSGSSGGSTMTERLIKSTVATYVNDNFFGNTCFLKSNLVLQGTAQCSRFFIRGSLVNHYRVYVVKPPPPPPVDLTGGFTRGVTSKAAVEWILKEEKYSQCGLVLRDCTLFVQGDVELTEAASMGGFSPGGYNVNAASTTSAPCYSSLSGTNATLVVSGNLKIVGGALDSRDKGMVIHARNMDLSTRGKFKGMILTQGAITINPYPTVTSSEEEASGEKLNVQGAIACLGEVLEEEDLDDPTSPPALPPRLEGLVLKSTNLVFDPKYVRAFHRFGQPRIGLWREMR